MPEDSPLQIVKSNAQLGNYRQLWRETKKNSRPWGWGAYTYGHGQEICPPVLGEVSDNRSQKNSSYLSRWKLVSLSHPHLLRQRRQPQVLSFLLCPSVYDIIGSDFCSLKCLRGFSWSVHIAKTKRERGKRLSLQGWRILLGQRAQDVCCYRIDYTWVVGLNRYKKPL